MASVIDQFNQAVAGFAALPVVHLAWTGAGLYLTLVWLACALWVQQDLRRRHASPVAPYVGAMAIVLASPVLFPLALMVYRIVRPGETLHEARERRLQDRLADLERQALVTCPDCRTLVDESWLLCPSCRTRLAHRCVECGRSMGLDWSLCAWCTTEPGKPTLLDAPQARAPMTSEQPVFQPQAQPQPKAATA